ncbi:MAG: UDP-N-acetylmuramoyl-L-alanine--D-glutamate ligase [Actinomycetota bacterium]|nr:UDP-N-acetylmuramoyl-L-alanine--D-glutamate ligase [Actinomycetota bacterium]
MIIGSPLPGAGELVVAAGAGVTGLPVVRFLAGRGARVLVTSNRPAPDELAAVQGEVTFVGDLQTVPAGTDLLVTSAGIPPHHPLLASAVAAGIEVIGEAELAWRVDQQPERIGGPRPWLVVTGTNGKTTTVTMLEAILRADGRQVTACGNVGWPVLDAVLACWPGRTRQEFIVAELSSFQLYYAPSISPHTGVVLNLAEDHLDWHGSMDAYAAAKALALTGDIAIAVVDDPGAARLLAGSPAGTKIGITLGAPAEGQLGVQGGTVVDRAFGNGALFAASSVGLAGNHNLTNAAAAAAMALTVGSKPPVIAAALAGFGPSPHRNEPVGEVDGVSFVNDSKATNPHAAAASLLAYPRVVWIAGGQLKGAEVDDLVIAAADRLAGVVLLGADAGVIDHALRRHAPDVPRISVTRTDDRAMDEVVRAARSLAAPGTTVLLAPAAASLDMFRSYAARGEAFAHAVAALDRA